MSTPKTRPNELSVESFLSQVEDEQKRKDCEKILKIMKSITKEDPIMWGGSIVGFGKYHYKYDSGREGDWFLTGFSPRKQNISIYIMSGFGNRELMSQLGKYKTGKSCLYIKKLEDVEVAVFKKLIKASVEALAKQRVK